MALVVKHMNIDAVWPEDLDLGMIEKIKAMLGANLTFSSLIFTIR